MDIATVITSDGYALALDWAMCGFDLESDLGLRTAVIISLFTDRRANADDVLPDGGTDRRGWWGDMPINSGTIDAALPDMIGSRLWLLERAKATTQTAALATSYAQEALAWMIADGIAQSVKATAKWISRDQLALYVNIARIAANGTPVNHEYDFVWNPALVGQPVFPCVSPQQAQLPYITTESGQQITTESGQPLV